ncbi:hypothetical protein FGO68_gene707 [Halteria grandinella]|uniref:C2 domain-containing protein n=1 Tax=Halteria grandinella TaxID=5974 RepID=A0A8J8NYU2_HALGN|nr:hypothetical protein FGO68_gene707 [Halteria grandinella]
MLQAGSISNRSNNLSVFKGGENTSKQSSPITLSIRVHEGNLMRNTEAVGKMDPFVQFIHNGDKYRTKTHKDGGFSPQWGGEEIQIPIKSINEKIVIKCLDEDFLMNDVVGEATLQVRNLYPPTKGGLGGPSHSDWVSLEYKGQIAALILIETKLNSPYTQLKPLVSNRQYNSQQINSLTPNQTPSHLKNIGGGGFAQSQHNLFQDSNKNSLAIVPPKAGARRASLEYSANSILEEGQAEKGEDKRQLKIVDEDNASSKGSSSHGNSEKHNTGDWKNAPTHLVDNNKNASDSTKNKQIQGSPSSKAARRTSIEIDTYSKLLLSSHKGKDQELNKTENYTNDCLGSSTNLTAPTAQNTTIDSQRISNFSTLALPNQKGGKLKIYVARGELTHNTEAFGEMDPYITQCMQKWRQASSLE